MSRHLLSTSKQILKNLASKQSHDFVITRNINVSKLIPLLKTHKYILFAGGTASIISSNRDNKNSFKNVKRNKKTSLYDLNQHYYYNSKIKLFKLRALIRSFILELLRRKEAF